MHCFDVIKLSYDYHISIEEGYSRLSCVTAVVLPFGAAFCGTMMYDVTGIVSLVGVMCTVVNTAPCSSLWPVLL